MFNRGRFYAIPERHGQSVDSIVKELWWKLIVTAVQIKRIRTTNG